METQRRRAWSSVLKSIAMAMAFTMTLAVPLFVARGADAPDPDSVTGHEPTEHSREQMERKLHDAQERLEKAAREVAELSATMSDEIGPEVARLSHMGSRPMLGIGIDMDGNGAGSDGHGVRVMSVSPGGPADKAGIKANDVIVSFAGNALVGSAALPPQRQFLAAIRDAKASQSAVIEYRRDGKLIKTQIVPKSVAESLADIRMFSDDAPMALDLQHWPRMHPLPFGMHDDEGFGSAELVELSPQLGQYFGVEKGLLVVRAPHDERFKLKDGDVILDIDGRTPSGVSHAFQILSSYRPGEALKLHLMRQQKRIELAVEVPPESMPSAAPSRLPPLPPLLPPPATSPPPPPPTPPAA